MRRDQGPPVRVLFLCMGNICRSPTAEALLRDAIVRNRLESRIEVDSAGTEAYHVGDPPDPRSIAVAAERGVDMRRLRARQIGAADLQRFDWVLAADRGNLAALERRLGSSGSAGRELMLPFAGVERPLEVPDPYYGSHADFVEVFELLRDAMQRLCLRLADSA